MLWTFSKTSKHLFYVWGHKLPTYDQCQIYNMSVAEGWKLMQFMLHICTLAHHRGILPMVAWVSVNFIVRTLPHTFLTTSTIQIIDVDRPYALSIASMSTNGSYKFNTLNNRYLCMCAWSIRCSFLTMLSHIKCTGTQENLYHFLSILKVKAFH